MIIKTLKYIFCGFLILIALFFCSAIFFGIIEGIIAL